MEPLTQGVVGGLARVVGAPIGKAIGKSGPVGRLVSFVTGGPPVFVWGPSGAGKSTLLRYLGTGDSDLVQNRTSHSTVTKLKSSGHRIRAVDTPGQARLDIEVAKALLDYRDDVTIAMFVAANGLLVPAARVSDSAAAAGLEVDGPFGADDYLDAECRPTPQYRDDGLAAEWKAFTTFGRLLRTCPRLRRVAIVVNKAELWWPDRDAVLTRYRTGEWGKLLDLTPGLHSVSASSAADFPLLPTRHGLPDPARNFPTIRTMDGQQRFQLRKQLLELLTT